VYVIFLSCGTPLKLTLARRERERMIVLYFYAGSQTLVLCRSSRSQNGNNASADRRELDYIYFRHLIFKLPEGRYKRAGSKDPYFIGTMKSSEMEDFMERGLFIYFRHLNSKSPEMDDLEERGANESGRDSNGIKQIYLV
jgi:hypothetical protein